MFSLSKTAFLLLPLLAIVADLASAAAGGVRAHQAKHRRAAQQWTCKPKGGTFTTAKEALIASTTSTGDVPLIHPQYESPAPEQTQAPAPPPAPAAPTTKAQAPPPPAPAPAPAPASSGGSALNKRCLGINNPPWVSNAALAGTIDTVYTWSPWCSVPGVACAPMLWGTKQVDDFNKNFPGYAAAGIKTLLFVNEPDQTGQSNMSPQSAADLWWQTFANLRGQFYRVGAALTPSPGSIQWQHDFMNLVASNPPEALALHWYGTKASDMISYLEEFHNNFPNFKLWVTEFACQNFAGGAQCTDIPGFMDVVVRYMNNQPWIEKYCWFGDLIDMAGVDENNRILKMDGSGFNQLGLQYISY